MLSFLEPDNTVLCDFLEDCAIFENHLVSVPTTPFYGDTEAPLESPPSPTTFDESIFNPPVHLDEPIVDMAEAQHDLEQCFFALPHPINILDDSISVGEAFSLIWQGEQQHDSDQTFPVEPAAQNMFSCPFTPPLIPVSASATFSLTPWLSDIPPPTPMEAIIDLTLSDDEDIVFPATPPPWTPFELDFKNLLSESQTVPFCPFFTSSRFPTSINALVMRLYHYCDCELSNIKPVADGQLSIEFVADDPLQPEEMIKVVENLYTICKVHEFVSEFQMLAVFLTTRRLGELNPEVSIAKHEFHAFATAVDRTLPFC